MTLKLRMLTFSVVLGLAQIIAASDAACLQRGYRWSANPRDEKMPPRRGVAGRLDRALRNFMEMFPLFAAVVLAAHVSATHNALPRGVRGSTSGLASRTCPSMQPGYRCSVRSFGMS